ncbi:unnamed protein product [Cyprideis torosa]|uniref:Uncharacterized protein n=1 Tax=Cyprideis torosa TaxID=163714 RepID=A0A7R8WR20_9CRUS|nr:unnamed protein product [Cyprideis torosa]CAG0907173.1 unnamed protein product [Cyprideis torosa]
MRKNIQKIKKDTDLEEQTRLAQQKELERQRERAKRLLEAQKNLAKQCGGSVTISMKASEGSSDSFPSPGDASKKGGGDSGDSCSKSSGDEDDIQFISEVKKSETEGEEGDEDSGSHVNDVFNVPDDQGRVLVNVAHPSEEEDIFLAPQIGRAVKPRQIGGIRFMFDNIIESLSRLDPKTLPVIAFCDIFLRHTPYKRVLCVVPINTVQNWVGETKHWLPADGEHSILAMEGEVRPRQFPLHVFNDSHKTLFARHKVGIRMGWWLSCAVSL